MTDESEANNSSDPYENELYSGYTETEIREIHFRLLSIQLDEMYKEMKPERSKIARWEEEQ